MGRILGCTFMFALSLAAADRLMMPEVIFPHSSAPPIIVQPGPNEDCDANRWDCGEPSCNNRLVFRI